MTHANAIFYLGGVVIVGMLYHIYLQLLLEFPEEDSIVKDPVAYAAMSTIDFNKFKEDNWKGFEALWAAIQFRTFYKRFRLLISPQYAMFSILLMLAFFMIVAFVAQTLKADPEVNGYIGGFAALGAVSWRILIERGKILKKSVDKLRVTC